MEQRFYGRVGGNGVSAVRVGYGGYLRSIIKFTETEIYFWQ
jgi:hypothetical protein